MPRHITVVYTIHDEEAAAPVIDQLGADFKAYDPGNPPGIGISAMSNQNEMKRLELIEMTLEENDASDAVDSIEDLLGTTRLPD